MFYLPVVVLGLLGIAYVVSREGCLLFGGVDAGVFVFEGTGVKGLAWVGKGRWKAMRLCRRMQIVLCWSLWTIMVIIRLVMLLRCADCLLGHDHVLGPWCICDVIAVSETTVSKGILILNIRPFMCSRLLRQELRRI